ncbi:MAG: HAD family phosphatase [Clostridia bacterium]|nr:HAD family phosphatase [Clostridia bacterium]
MIEAYIFDFDGTLADSMPTWSEGMMQAIKKSGVEYPENIIEILTPLGDVGGTKYLEKMPGMKYSAEELRQMVVEYTTPRYLEKVQAKESVIEYVKSLKKLGKKTAVLTASAHSRIDGCIKRWGLWDSFDLVRTCDDYAMTKANPKIYDEIAQELGVEKNKIAFFDDNLEVIRTVKQAGMFAVGVYDESGKGFLDKLMSEADVFVQKMGDAGIL